MRQVHTFLIAFTCLAPHLVAAQTASDGELALQRGDIAKAVEILRPLAEDPRGNDPLAQFHMASLYERGQGVSPDRLRACALLVRISLPDPTRPITVRNETRPQLMDEARKKVYAFQAAMSRDEFDECVLLSTVGFDHKFEPATYVLETGSWVEVRIGGVTIVNQGKRSHFKWGISRPGVRFLPSHFSELARGRPETRRRFVEVAAWVPQSPRWDMWELIWHLFEVTPEELIPVTMRPLARVTAQEPPNSVLLNINEMASVRLNDAGLVEWRTRGMVADGAVIPSAAERRAQEKEVQLRRDAEARFDWKRVGDVRRPPALAYGNTDGCGLISVHGWSDDRMETISLNADSEVLRLSNRPQTFDISTQPTTLDLRIHVYERPVPSWPFCTDIVHQTGPREEWRAQAGHVTIELTSTVDASGERRYRATIRISAAVFVNAQGVRVQQAQPITLTAAVGAFYG